LKFIQQHAATQSDNEKKKLKSELRNQSGYVAPILSFELGLPTKFSLQ
jgi:hypothetical protein